MPSLPADWGALCAVVFLLGLRHGLDADHIAAVDAMTRMNMQAGRRGARWCGILFALGHGCLVLAVALLMSGATARWALPTWLDATGAGLSIALLFFLGFANLRALLATPPGAPVRPVTFKGRWFGGSVPPSAAAGIGALFAISFDTLSQAALFGLTSAKFGGTEAAVTLAALFASGMALIDGGNGWWVSRMLGRTDATAVAVSRALGWVIAAVSLGVGAFGAVRLAWPAATEMAQGYETAQGAVVILIVLTSWLAARRLALRPALV